MILSKRKIEFFRAAAMVMTALIAVGYTSVSLASSELDDEIDKLSVELRPAPYQKKPAQRARVLKKQAGYQATSIPRASAQPTTYTTVAANDVIANGQTLSPASDLSTSSAPAKLYHGKNTSLFSRFTVMPMYVVSTFDGSDQGLEMPNANGNSQYTANFSGALLTDINFGFEKLFLETGVDYLNLGANTGFKNYSTTYYAPLTINNETLNLTYLGLPLRAKYLFSGERRTSIYLKGGASPVALVSSQYQDLNGPAYIGNRFTPLSTFDVLFDADLGLSVPVYRGFGASIEAGYFHGILPVSPNFNLYNTGFTVGLGINYIL